jgi:hypothetical protein
VPGWYPHPRVRMMAGACPPWRARAGEHDWRFVLAGRSIPSTRPELFDAILAGWFPYGAVVDRLTGDQWLSPVDDQGWSTKEHVANVTAWENVITEVLRSGKRPEETLQLAPGSFESDPVAAADLAIYRLTTGQSVRRALRNRSITHTRLVTTLSGLDDAVLVQPFADLAGIGGEASVITFVGTFLPNLYRLRREAIETLVGLPATPLDPHVT